jgi:hypothetical protein
MLFPVHFFHPVLLPGRKQRAADNEMTSRSETPKGLSSRSSFSSRSQDRRARFVATSSTATRSVTGAGEDTRSDLTSDFVPQTAEEKLLARLEPHGIRRHVAEMCYFCVACEAPVTKLAVDLSAVQCAYHHCGSAQHRRAIRFMALEETDAALLSPVAPDPKHYAIASLNGIRVLICTLPNGGGILYNSVFHAAEDHNSVEADLSEHSNGVQESPIARGDSFAENRRKRLRGDGGKSYVNLHFPRRTFFTETLIRCSAASHNSCGEALSHRRLVNFRFARVPLQCLQHELSPCLQEVVPEKTLDDAVDVQRLVFAKVVSSMELDAADDVVPVKIRDGGVYRLVLRPKMARPSLDAAQVAQASPPELQTHLTEAALKRRNHPRFSPMRHAEVTSDDLSRGHSESSSTRSSLSSSPSPSTLS